jgi:glutamine amidotransferase
VLSSLRDELFHFVQGNTDSEWAFAVFLNQFSDPLNGSYSAEEIEHALMQTIAAFNHWFRVAEITSKSLMNFAVTDGRTMICSRYVNSKELEPASLYFSSGGAITFWCTLT